MKNLSRFLCVALVLMIAISSASYAEDTLSSDIKYFQDFFDGFLADDWHNNLSCEWEYLFTNKDGDTYYKLLVTDPDGSKNEIGACFVSSEDRTRVDGILYFCDVSDELWNNSTYMHTVGCLINEFIFLTNACDDSDSFNRELDKYYACLKKYYPENDFEAKYKLLGDIGSFGLHYFQSDNESTDFITLEFYFV